jgi:hypothetical protein
MNSKYMFIVATMAVMLIGATAFATDSAFADGKKNHGKNQAASQANACGNDKMPTYVFCQNTNSQVQGEDNVVTLNGVQSSGEVRHGGGDHGGGDHGNGGDDNGNGGDAEGGNGGDADGSGGDGGGNGDDD